MKTTYTKVMDGDEQRQNKMKTKKQKKQKQKKLLAKIPEKIKNQSSAQNMARSKQYKFFLELIGFWVKALIASPASLRKRRWRFAYVVTKGAIRDVYD